MPATPDYLRGGSFHWFEAQFTSGSCRLCDENIREGDMISYVDGPNGRRVLIRQECCGSNIPFPDEPTDDSALPTRIQVMPRGRKASDRCDRCFIIHTAAQGDECE